MHIDTVQIQNYKSYQDSKEIRLTPGFNVIVGQNNAGKTAFVEALSLQFTNKAHLSMKTSPVKGDPLYDNTSKVRITFQLAEGEAKQLLLNARDRVYLPIPDSVTDYNEYVALFLGNLPSSTILKCVYRSGRFDSAYLDSIGEPDIIKIAAIFTVDIPQQKLKHSQGVFQIDPNTSYNWYGDRLANIARNKIYIFRAERLNISYAPFGEESVLSSDASNLAEVLHNLQTSNPYRFNKLNQHIGTIFPEIKQISVPPASHTQVRILVWSIDPDTEREDLAIPLAESGTGIGQVLAMLYVVLTADKPQTIIIDEPQSFLNPGAIRKLLEILKQYAQHQFIITTHSPEVVSAANPKTLMLMQKIGTETVVTQLDSTKTQDQKLLLSEVGTRLSDVFGADNILWVEGATEEATFLLIVEQILKKPLRGTKILGVVQTGDFESKHSDVVLKIYDRLTKGEGLIPPAVGFIFDQEKRTEQQKADLIRRSQGKIAFLPRTMYENYLLNAGAIAALMSQIEGFRDKPVTPEEVHEKLQLYMTKSVYKTPEEWHRKESGAKILQALFRELSENRVEYDKVQYGLVLTKWIIQHAPEELQEVADLIDSKIAIAEVVTPQHIADMAQPY